MVPPEHRDSCVTTASDVMQSPLSPAPLRTIPQFEEYPSQPLASEPFRDDNSVQLIDANYTETEYESDDIQFRRQGRLLRSEDQFLSEEQVEFDARTQLPYGAHRIEGLGVMTGDGNQVGQTHVPSSVYSDSDALSTSSMNNVMAIRTTSDGFSVRSVSRDSNEARASGLQGPYGYNPELYTESMSDLMAIRTTSGGLSVRSSPDPNETLPFRLRGPFSHSNSLSTSSMNDVMAVVTTSDGFSIRNLASMEPLSPVPYSESKYSDQSMEDIMAIRTMSDGLQVRTSSRDSLARASSLRRVGPGFYNFEHAAVDDFNTTHGTDFKQSQVGYALAPVEPTVSTSRATTALPPPMMLGLGAHPAVLEKKGLNKDGKAKGKIGEEKNEAEAEGKWKWKKWLKWGKGPKSEKGKGKMTDGKLEGNNKRKLVKVGSFLRKLLASAGLQRANQAGKLSGDAPSWV